MSESFEPDEFDDIAAKGGPVGVHRAPRPWWTRVVVPLLAFLLAGALAYVVASYFWSRDVADSGAGATPSATATATATPSPSASASETASPSVTPSPSPTLEIDYEAPVGVQNGAGIQGLAAKQQAILLNAGFTKVTATNLTGTKPTANVVVYAKDDQAATAQAVAKELGISAVEQGSTPAGIEVLVKLVTDPAA